MKFISYLLSLLLLPMLSAAATAEDQQFFDFDNNSRAIENYFDPDKWTVVMIWRHDCHICNQEAQSYSFFHDDNERTQVLGLSMDGLLKKEKAENFITTHDLSFHNLIGEPKAVMNFYQMKTGARFIGTPTIMVFNPHGELLAAQAGAVSPEVIRSFIDSKTK